MKKSLISLSIILLSGFIVSTVLFGCQNATTVNPDNYEDNAVEPTLTPESIDQDEVDVTDPLETPQPTPEVTPAPSPAVTPDSMTTESEDGLTTTQRNSINMLNYISVLTQQINESKNSRIYLDFVQSSLLNNIYPNAVDSKTQGQINNLWKTIDGYRMIAVKRERLEYIYEQNKAQALREAIPNPLGLLSAVQSGNLLKATASVLYMAVDAKTSYDKASTQADLQYLQDGWELEDEETKELSNSQLNLLNYLFNMVRENDFPGEYSLNVESVKDYVIWSNEKNLVRKVTWFESNVETYKEFRTYWLELIKTYYQQEDFEKCLEAVERYEIVATRIFRKDYDYAETLPLAIIAAKEVLDINEYNDYADKYARVILSNCDEENWALRYFVAQTFIDLFVSTQNQEYLDEAFRIAFENVNLLVSEQEILNADYLAPVVEEKTTKDMSKRQKQEVKEYNSLIKEKREKELPPVSEALYLNCDLLFALADELNVSESKRSDIDSILHGDDSRIFLTEVLDNKYWASDDVKHVDCNSINIKFDGEELVIPANLLCDKSRINVLVSGGYIIDDWQVKEVKRPKGSEDISEFSVSLTSEKAKEYVYTMGEEISVNVITVIDKPDEFLSFNYRIVEKTSLGIIKSNSFERLYK